MDIYKPQGCLTLAETVDTPTIRLGIQSPPGLGKTFSALTFPFPIVINFNKGLGAHTHREDVIDAKFWDATFVDKIVKRTGTLLPPNKKDALTIWLGGEGLKLTVNQTLVMDSMTEIESAFHIQYEAEGGAPISKTGSIDKYDEYKKKLAWYGYFIEQVKTLKCNVILITHEITEWSKEGEATGAAKPLLSGQAGDKIVGDFTDWVRQHAVAKPISDDAKKRFKDKYYMNDEQYMEALNSTPKEHSTIYLWQTQADAQFMIKTSTLFNAPKFVVANYSSFEKYKRKVIQ